MLCHFIEYWVTRENIWLIEDRKEDSNMIIVTWTLQSRCFETFELTKFKLIENILSQSIETETYSYKDNTLCNSI